MFTRRGQSILEYTIIIGIVTVVLYYMGTGIKRGVQSMVKVTADQVGSQQNADQDFSSQQGYMVASNTVTQQSKDKQMTDSGSMLGGGNAVELTNVSVNESSEMQTNTITNAGFTSNP